MEVQTQALNVNCIAVVISTKDAIGAAKPLVLSRKLTPTLAFGYEAVWMMMMTTAISLQPVQEVPKSPKMKPPQFYALE